MKHIAIALSLATAVVATTGRAQTTGTVQVRVVDSAGRPLDGTVTFRSGNATSQCRTVASRCSIGLAPGTWSADVAPTRERSAGAQTIAVRAGTVANLTFRTTAAAPATTTAATTTTTTAATTSTTTTSTTATATPTVRTNVQSNVGTTAVAPTVRTAPGVRTVSPQRSTTTTTTTATAPTTTTTVPRATAPGVTATAPGVVRTAPGVTTTSPTVAPRAVTTTTTTTPSTRDLGRGTRVCAQGNVTDSVGRPADATVTVLRDGTMLGTVRSVAGRFSMFDLPPGRYALRAVSARDGSVVQQTLDLGPDVARVVVRVR